MFHSFSILGPISSSFSCSSLYSLTASQLNLKTKFQGKKENGMGPSGYGGGYDLCEGRNMITLFLVWPTATTANHHKNGHITCRLGSLDINLFYKEKKRKVMYTWLVLDIVWFIFNSPLNGDGVWCTCTENCIELYSIYH